MLFIFLDEKKKKKKTMLNLGFPRKGRINTSHPPGEGKLRDQK